MTDIVYSLGLLASMICAGLAVLLLFRRAAPGSVAILCAAGLVCLLVSLGVHWTWGHGAASPEPMGPTAFLREHPAYVSSFAVLALAVIVAAAIGHPPTSD